MESHNQRERQRNREHIKQLARTFAQTWCMCIDSIIFVCIGWLCVQHLMIMCYFRIFSFLPGIWCGSIALLSSAYEFFYFFYFVGPWLWLLLLFDCFFFHSLILFIAICKSVLHTNTPSYTVFTHDWDY